MLQLYHANAAISSDKGSLGSFSEWIM